MGCERRDRYLAALRERFGNLRQWPELGAPRNDLGTSYRCLPVGRHVIFYRVAGDALHILRVLHQRMDVKLHL
ncbi:MAG: type II toxin-antitoxin system RelE/ParE family toxin [Proteobacteria bacterium]|nr:type II toxin-antitoxin system RelE/ParE family toxin [Pseudomonadota bacterium]